MQRMLVLALLVLAIPATAQPTEYGFSEDYLARIGEGDMSITQYSEGAGWHIAEYLRVQHDGNQTQVPIGGDASSILTVSCDCGSVSRTGSMLNVGNDVAAGPIVVSITRSLAGSNAIEVTFALYGGQAGRMVAYVPEGLEVLTPATQISGGLPCTTGTCTIAEYEAGGEYYVVAPAAAAPAPIVDDDDNFVSEFGPAILALFAGMAIWAILVKQNIVQKRRSQEIKVAAHVEAAKAESKDVLTARKRVLMSGLKELEKAKMAKEIDTDVYDQLKAELKKETVTVMRAMEAAE